jgi:hypothetical protein
MGKPMRSGNLSLTLGQKHVAAKTGSRRISYLKLTKKLKRRSIDRVIFVERRRQSRRITQKLADVAAYGHDPAFTWLFDAKPMPHWRPSHPARVEVEASVDHDNSLWMISGLIAHVSQRSCTSYKRPSRRPFDLEPPGSPGCLGRS